MKENAKELLLDSLLLNNTEKLIETASILLASPIMLTDTDYSYITHYPKGTAGDDLWDDIITNGKPSVKWINELAKCNMICLGEKIGIHFFNWGVFAACPRIIVVLKDGAQHYGFLSILSTNVEENYKKMILLISSVFIMHRKNIMGNSPAPTDRKSIFMTYLLTNKISSKEELDQWLIHIETTIRPEYRIIMLDMNFNESAHLLYNYIPRTKNHILTYYEGKNIFLLMTSAQRDFENYLQTLQKSMKHEVCYIGVSTEFDDLLDAMRYKAEAILACRYGKKHMLPICYYEECILEHILETIHKFMKPVDYTPPAIIRIKKYDKINNTHLFDTLQCYIKNQFNIKSTIEELGIHRNSLPKRLERIKEVGRITLDDYETCLLLSLYLSLNKVV